MRQETVQTGVISDELTAPPAATGALNFFSWACLGMERFGMGNCRPPCFEPAEREPCGSSSCASAGGPHDGHTPSPKKKEDEAGGHSDGSEWEAGKETGDDGGLRICTANCVDSVC